MIGAFQAGVMYGGTPWWLSAGVNPIAAYSPKGAGSLANSYINLVNPGTNDAYAGSAPTFDASRGWVFNGSSHYLKTGITPTSQNSTIILRVNLSSVSSDYKVLCGVRGVANITYFGTAPSGIQYMNGAVTSRIMAVSLPSDAVLAISGNACYRNGDVEPIGPLGNWSGTTSGEIYLGCFNRISTGSPDAFSAVEIMAFAFYDSALSAGQVKAISTAMGAV